MAMDDLHGLKDDMNAFILGHGMSRFPAYISEEMDGVLWENAGETDSWKEFVEIAKANGASFLTFSEDTLEKEDLEFLMERMDRAATLDEEFEDARLLRQHVGKLGFIQLGFPCQGTMFLWECSTSWYDRYQLLLESSDEFSPILLDEQDQSDDDDR
jgi:hypothetical protein